eukprot:6830080-Prorocentrum_lima.AAC.1
MFPLPSPFSTRISWKASGGIMHTSTLSWRLPKKHPTPRKGMCKRHIARQERLATPKNEGHKRL